MDFGSLLEEFKDYYNKFKSDLISGSLEYQELIALKPITLPRFSNLLQIGSRLPSVQYSPDLKGMIWDKLVEKFPSSTYNGVKIPNLPLGESFSVAFPTRGEFPGEMFKLTVKFKMSLLTARMEEVQDNTLRKGCNV